MTFNKEIIFKDYTDTPPITDAIKKENMNRTFTGGVRINNGLFRTKEEHEEYRAVSLARELP